MNQKVKQQQSAENSKRKVMKLFMVASAGMLMMEPSIAAAAPWDDAVRAIVNTLQGNLGRGIAVIAVIALGIMAMAGRLEWGTAIKVVLGIVIMFSAGQIINWISPTAGTNAIAATSEKACNDRGYVWVPESVAVTDSKGVVIPQEGPRCVEKDSAPAVCASTVKSQTDPDPMVAGSRATPVYYTYATGGLRCN